MSQIASIDMLALELAKRRKIHVQHASEPHKHDLIEWRAKLNSYDVPLNDPEKMKKLVMLSRKCAAFILSCAIASCDSHAFA